MPTYTLPPEVSDILRKSTIFGNTLKLPPGQLDRKTYTAVNKAVEVAGGKWNAKAKAHLFDGDRIKDLIALLKVGVTVVPITRKKQFQSFYTPPGLAEKVARFAQVKGKIVLEPSAGRGALVEACATHGARGIKCIELDPEAVADLKNDGLSGVVQADFLTCEPKPYERIVMNPPFTKNQDIAHVCHALKFLKKKGGILVAIMSPRTDREGFQDLIEGRNWDITRVEKGSFKSAGTDIETIILKIWT